jgi:hypothetical protein
MVSSVRSRPNHYDTLGVAPSASDEEIRQAFAKKMTLFAARPLGATAQVIGAYETLKDPVRRRNYDKSLGLLEEPQPAKPAFSIPRAWQPFTVSVHTELMDEAPRRIARDPDPRVVAPLRKEQRRTEPLIRQVLAARREASDTVDYPSHWKGPALTLGGLVLGAGVLGAMAGLSVGGDAAAQAEPVPTLAAAGLAHHTFVKQAATPPRVATGSHL